MRDVNKNLEFLEFVKRIRSKSQNVEKSKVDPDSQALRDASPKGLNGKVERVFYYYFHYFVFLKLICIMIKYVILLFMAFLFFSCTTEQDRKKAEIEKETKELKVKIDATQRKLDSIKATYDSAKVK